MLDLNNNYSKNTKLKFLVSIISCVILFSIVVVLFINKEYIETYLIERNADSSYYGQICNDCKYHKEKIQQSIDAGADSEWWNHMCTDFFK